MTTSVKKPRSLRGQICSPQSELRRTALVLGLTSAVFTPQVMAAEGGEVVDLDTIEIQDRTLDTNPYAEPGAPYKAKKSGDARYRKDIADTPKNIQVLTKKQIEDSGYTDLREILDTQPGITLGTGENGNAFGDRYIIRGQEARSDVFVDGLRDPGMSIRESFAVEQIEISKGPDSSFGGRGTTGGAINSITKQASRDYNFTKLSAAVGTDHHHRTTIDVNQPLGEDFAVRGNFLHAYEDVPDRDPADRERIGLALSGLYEPNAKFSALLDVYVLRAEDTPDLGFFLTGSVANGDREPATNVPVYAQDQDFLSSDIDTITARLSYAFDPTLRLSNATRLGQAANRYVATGARFGNTDRTNPGGAYRTITLSTHQGWQDIDYLANQTNLFVDRSLFGMLHQFNVGLEYTNHKALNGVFNVTNTPNCKLPDGNDPGPAPDDGFCATQANGTPVPNINGFMQRVIAKGPYDSDWSIETVSYSLMDTIDITERWAAFGGVRHDDYTYDLLTRSNAGVERRFDLDDSTWSYHAGLTFKFLPYANVYFSYATASDINGGESDVGTSGAYGGLAVAPDGEYSGAPEETESFEFGTKWNLFDQKLLATAAIFRINKDEVFETAITNPGDPNRYDNLGTLNTGKSRINGLELGLAGNLTKRISVQGGVAWMDARIQDSNNPTRIGKTLSNFADLTGSFQLRFQATEKIALGGAMKYESEKYAGQPDTAPSFDAFNRYTQPIPEYAVGDLFADYTINKHANVRLNVGNVSNEDYFLAGYQSGAFLYKGDARNVRLTLNYDF
ncbi:MAG TPA: TonB-dependent receptor [Gammaproteobacteria bacterium]|nr:TonB-dependent receptor [Gammaproteobacteria bacterium]